MVDYLRISIRITLVIILTWIGLYLIESAPNLTLKLYDWSQAQTGFSEVQGNEGLRFKSFERARSDTSWAWYHIVVIGFAAIAATVALLSLFNFLQRNFVNTIGVMTHLYWPATIAGIDGTDMDQCHILSLSNTQAMILCHQKLNRGTQINLILDQVPSQLNFQTTNVAVVEKVRRASQGHYYCWVRFPFNAQPDPAAMRA